jgi:Arc/MetJ-type ribon-helix-helix transcriptional regulator
MPPLEPVVNRSSPVTPPAGVPQWYDRGMTKVAKITISLPAEQVEQARAAVARGQAASVSSYISSALAAVPPPMSEDDEDGDSLAKLVADMQAEFGRPSPEAYAWADEVMRSAERGGVPE